MVTLDKPNVLISKLELKRPPQDSNIARELIQAFRRHHDRLLVVDSQSGHQWTGCDLLKQTCQLAHALMQPKLGLELGDVVLMMCDHSEREMLLVLASLLSGATVLGSCTSGLQDLKSTCEPTKPKFIVTSNKLFPQAIKLRQMIGPMNDSCIIVLEKQQDNEIQLNLTEHQNNNNIFLMDELECQSDDIETIEQIAFNKIKPKSMYAFFMLTSGSTGKSKVVPWTHERQLLDLWSIVSASQQSVCESNLSGSEPMFPVDDKCILSGDLPIDQGAGVQTMLWSMITGCQFVIMPSYDEDAFWLAVSKYRITSSVASTTFVYKLLKKLKTWIDEGQTDKLDITSLKYINCVGAKMAFIDLVEEVKRVYRHLTVCQFYGATEIGFISMLTVQDSRNHLNSVGHLSPGVKAKVIDMSTGHSLGPNRRGEMYVWSPTLFKNYLPHPDESLDDLMAGKFDNDGFYRTGDLVHYDEEERFYIHDRLRDTLFLMEDWKTSPSELEDIINKHPLVDASCVVGIPDPDLPGCDLPKAFVKLINPSMCDKFEWAHSSDRELLERLKRKDYDFITDHIYNFTADLTAKPKHLRGGVLILEKFPMTGALGKIDRNALRNMQ